MTKYAKYQFQGDDSRDCFGLEYGKEYNLAIYKMSWFERLFSRFPVDWNIIVYRPFELNTCLMPYHSEKEFNKKWLKISTKNEQENISKSLILN